MRGVTIWARASLARYVALVAAVAGMAAVFTRSAWLGEWAWTMDWSAGTTFVIGPIAAGAAAYEVQRNFQPAGRALARTLARGPIALWQLTTAIWAAAFAGWLLVAAVAALASVAAGATPQLVLEPLIGTASVLAAYAAAGSALATVLPKIAAAPLAAILTYSFPIAAAALGVASPFMFGGATGTLAGLSYNHATLAWVILLNLGLAALLLSFSTLALRVPKPRSVLISTMAIASCASLIGSALALGPLPNRFVIEPSVNMVCGDGAPKICMSSGSASKLDEIQGLASDLSLPLSTLGVELPERYMQQLPGRPAGSGSGVLLLPDSNLNHGPTMPMDVALSLARPADCSAYYASEPPVAALDAQYVVARWLVLQGEVSGAQDEMDPADRWLSQSAPEESADWIRSVFKRLERCDLGSISLPYDS